MTPAVRAITGASRRAMPETRDILLFSVGPAYRRDRVRVKTRGYLDIEVIRRA
jgi:hypothetical protein